jgi:hypothetical protein
MNPTHEPPKIAVPASLSVSTSLILPITPLDRMNGIPTEVCEYIALAAILCIIAACVVALFNFRKENSRTNRANAIVLAVLPFIVALILGVAGQEPLVHGISFPALFLTAPSPNCAR